MAGICQVDGKAVETLYTCPVCGAKVCAKHLLAYGCAICKGRKMI